MQLPGFSPTNAVGYAKVCLILMGGVAVFFFKLPLGEVTATVLALSLALSGIGFTKAQDARKDPSDETTV